MVNVCLPPAVSSVTLTPYELQDLLSRQTINDVSTEECFYLNRSHGHFILWCYYCLRVVFILVKRPSIGYSIVLGIHSVELQWSPQF